MGKLSKSKGGAYERTVAALLAPVWPRAKRSIGQARFGAEKPDVDGTPLWCEAKHANRAHRSAILDGYEQAVEALARYVEAGGSPTDYAFPICVGRVDTGRRGRPRRDLVILSLEDFLSLVRGTRRLPVPEDAGRATPEMP
jgi:hypothetical protein